MAENWEVLPLSELARVDRGASWGKNQERLDGSGLPVIRIANVQPNGLDLGDVRSVAGLAERDVERSRIDIATLVMVGSNGNPERIGNVYQADPSITGMALASFLIGIHAKSRAESDWIYYALSSPKFQTRIRESTSGSTGLKNLSLEWLRAMPIPVPPRHVQRRIVDLMSHLDRHLANLFEERRVLTGLWEHLLQDPLGEGELISLGELLERIDVGKSPSGEERTPDPSERAVLKVSAIGRNRFHPDEVKTVAPSIELPPLSRVMAGDVLMVRANGVLNRVGQVCIVPKDFGNLYLCDKTLRLVPKAGLDPTYLLCSLLAPTSRQQIRELTGGSDMRNISQASIKQIKIPYISLERQLDLGALITKTSAGASALEYEFEELSKVRRGMLSALLSGDQSILERYDTLLSMVA